MTLTTHAKDWLAQNAGANNCFAGSGIVYEDVDGTLHSGRTGDVANAFYTALLVGNNTATIIAGTNYAQFKAINDNNDLSINDVGWVYTNDGGIGTTTTAYCLVSQLGFNAGQMLIIAGLAVGAIYAITRKPKE